MGIYLFIQLALSVCIVGQWWKSHPCCQYLMHSWPMVLICPEVHCQRDSIIVLYFSKIFTACRSLLYTCVQYQNSVANVYPVPESIDRAISVRYSIDSRFTECSKTYLITVHDPSKVAIILIHFFFIRYSRQKLWSCSVLYYANTFCNAFSIACLTNAIRARQITCPAAWDSLISAGQATGLFIFRGGGGGSGPANAAKHVTGWAWDLVIRPSLYLFSTSHGCACSYFSPPIHCTLSHHN